jgi:hypothetical protein
VSVRELQDTKEHTTGAAGEQAVLSLLGVSLMTAVSFLGISRLGCPGGLLAFVF